MGRDRVIDPATRDYVSDGAGGTETTRTAATAVYHQMRGARGKWAGDPNAGGRFHELARAKSTLRTSVVVVDILEELLQPLIEAGLVSAPTIVVERETDRLAAETTVTDLRTREEIQLVSLLPFDV